MLHGFVPGFIACDTVAVQQNQFHAQVEVEEVVVVVVSWVLPGFIACDTVAVQQNQFHAQVVAVVVVAAALVVVVVVSLSIILTTSRLVAGNDN